LREEQEFESFDDLARKISSKFDFFKATYLKFRSNGYEPELEAMDKKMANELKGLFVLLRVEDSSNLKNKVDHYYSKVIVCKNLVEEYLKR
jgi:hypothetical protein